MLIISLDYIGTFAFAISGALAAIDKKLDLFGILVIAFVTALGGGTLRDILIGQQPVGWMLNIDYLYLVLSACVVTYIYRARLMAWRKALFVFDAAGLAVFSILGFEKAFDLSLSAPVAILMGVISAVFGGVIRDILCNEIPLIFRREIYATACFAGTVLHFALRDYLPLTLLTLMTILFILTVRVISVKYSLHLPTLADRD